MKRFYFILLMLAGALAFSCTRGPSPGHDSPETGFKTIHYKVLVSSSGISKATTAENDTKYVFQATDSLYVSSTDPVSGDVQLFGVLTLISGSGETTAYFEGNLVGVNEFEPDSDTPINVTLVSSEDRIHTTSEGQLTDTSYPSGEYGTTLADAVQKFSNFTCSTTFGATRFTLSQQSAFLIFTVSFKRSEVPVTTPVTAKVFNNNEANPIWQAEVSATALGSARSSADFVVAFPGGSTSLTDAELSVIWGNGANDHKEFTIDDKVLAINNYYTVSRSTIDLGNPFHIRAKEDGTSISFKYTYATGEIQYLSYDLGVEDWTNYDGSSLDLSKDDMVYFKGARSDCNCSGNTQLFTSTNNKVCYIGGKIGSLLADDSTLAANAFRGAFSRKNTIDTGNNGCDTEKPTTITVSPSTPSDYVDWIDIDSNDPLILPATTAANCYMDMFLGCISLTSAPNLPATELADKCYFRMFHSCFGLTSMPSFPSVVTMSGSTTRRRYCYQMFQNCTGITALEEPLFVGVGSTLQRGCFEDMFAHCTSLTSVIPGLLPASTLAADCYRGMFQDTRFTTAPDLLAETLVAECYRFMFSGCTNLKNIKCLATQNLGNGYTTNWVGNNGTVNIPNNSECTFVRAGTTAWPSGAHGIPNNWTVKNDGE